MTYILGTKQTGKTTVLLNKTLTAIYSGDGVFVLGDDIVSTLIRYIPKDRVNDVIVFDPSLKNPATINLLDTDTDTQQPFLTKSVLNLFRDLAGYTGSTGRFDRLIRNAVATVLNVPYATLLDIFYLLAVESYRDKHTEHLPDPFTKAFWKLQFETWSTRDRITFTESSFNQLDMFVSDPYVRRSLCYHKPTIHLSTALKEKKILLCRLPMEKLGFDTARIIGVSLLAAIHNHDTNIFIDDCLTYQGDTLRSLLNKHTHLTNHSHEQLTPQMRDAILNTSEENILLRLGGDDVDRFDRLLKIKDTQAISTGKLPDYKAYIGERVHPVEDVAFPVVKGSPKLIRKANVAKYRRRGEKIEREIYERANEVFGWKSS